jgi:hypothetical protein
MWFRRCKFLILPGTAARKGKRVKKARLRISKTGERIEVGVYVGDIVNSCTFGPKPGFTASGRVVLTPQNARSVAIGCHLTRS